MKQTFSPAVAAAIALAILLAIGATYCWNSTHGGQSFVDQPVASSRAGMLGGLRANRSGAATQQRRPEAPASQAP